MGLWIKIFASCLIFESISTLGLVEAGDKIKPEDDEVPARDNGCAVKPNVYYHIVAANSKMMATIANDSRDDLAQIVQTEMIGDPRHSFEWYFRSVEEKSNKYFYIINKFSGKYMEVPFEILEVPFRQNSFTQNTSQHFKFVADEFGRCKIESVLTKSVLSSIDITRGKNLVQYRDAGHLTQRWKLQEVDCDPHPDQMYQIEDRDGQKVLVIDQNQVDTLKVITKSERMQRHKFTFAQIGRTFHGGKGEDDADDASSQNQVLYRISPDGKDTVIQVIEKGIMQAPVNDKDDGRQHFYFVRKANNHACEIRNYKYENGLSINQNGEVVMAENKTQNATQWRLIPTDFELRFDPNTPYRIKNRKTGYFMDFFQGYGPDISPVQRPRTRPPQHFYFKKIQKRSQVYMIESVSTGQVLDARNNGMVEQKNGSNEKWQMFKVINLWQEKSEKGGKIVIIMNVMNKKAFMQVRETGYEVDLVQRPVNYEDERQQWEIFSAKLGSKG